MDRVEKVGFWKYVRDRYVVSYIAKFNTIALILIVIVVFASINDWFRFENSLNEKLRAIESADVKVLNTVIQEENNKTKKQSNKDKDKDKDKDNTATKEDKNSGKKDKE